LLMLRVKGLSVAIATIGFFLIVSVVFLNLKQFGGSVGMHGIPFFSYMLPLSGLTALALLFMFSRLMNSRLGRAIEAVHDDEEAAAALGVNVNGLKMFTFIASGFMASLGGVYYAHYVTYMAPNMFTFSSLISIFVFAVVGGFTTYWGPFVGTVVLWSLPEFIRPLAAWRTVAFTSVLILVMIFRPHGLLTKGMMRQASEALTATSRRLFGKALRE
ncbi:MAG: branched-chain amino acid ABC transporter permease, partial [Chloroflexota bacterium]